MSGEDKKKTNEIDELLGDYKKQRERREKDFESMNAPESEKKEQPPQPAADHPADRALVDPLLLRDLSHREPIPDMAAEQLPLPLGQGGGRAGHQKIEEPALVGIRLLLELPQGIPGVALNV